MPVELKLKTIREAKKISQNELSRMTGMSPQNIQKLEQGRSKGIQFDTLERLCLALEVGIQDLLVLVPAPSEEESV